MMVHLGVQRPLGQRLLQLVEQAVRIERRLRIGAGQQLVEDGVRNLRLFASRHVGAPLLPSCPTPHEIPDSPTPQPPFRCCLPMRQIRQPDATLPNCGRGATYSRDDPMESLLKGRLRNTHLPLSNAMTPVFEGIVNSIQAIEDDAAEGGSPIRQHRIEVRIERSSQGALRLEQKPAPREPIVAFEIEDDGVGFTEANWLSFGLLDSLDKSGKGLPRDRASDLAQSFRPESASDLCMSRTARLPSELQIRP